MNLKLLSTRMQQIICFTSTAYNFHKYLNQHQSVASTITVLKPFEINNKPFLK